MFGVRNTLTCGSQMRTDAGSTIVARIGLEVYQVLGAVVNIKQGTTVNLLGLSSVTTCPVKAEFVVLKTICGGSAAAVAPQGVAAGGVAAKAVQYGSALKNGIAWFFQLAVPAVTEGVALNKLYEAYEDITHYQASQTNPAYVSDAQAKNYARPVQTTPEVNFDTFWKAFWGDDTSHRFDKSSTDISFEIVQSKQKMQENMELKKTALGKPPGPPGGWAPSPAPAPSIPIEPPNENTEEASQEEYTQNTGQTGNTLQDQWKQPPTPPEDEPAGTPS